MQNCYQGYVSPIKGDLWHSQKWESYCVQKCLFLVKGYFLCKLPLCSWGRNGLPSLVLDVVPVNVSSISLINTSITTVIVLGSFLFFFCNIYLLIDFPEKTFWYYNENKKYILKRAEWAGAREQAFIVNNLVHYLLYLLLCICLYVYFCRDGGEAMSLTWPIAVHNVGYWILKMGDVLYTLLPLFVIKMTEDMEGQILHWPNSGQSFFV